MANSEIKKKIQSLLQTDTSPSEREAILNEARQDLVQKMEEHRGLYRLLPSHRYENDSQALEAAFARYDAKLAECQSALDQPASLESLLEALDHLKGVQFDFKEIIWSSAGPSTHPGLNELLVLMDQENKTAVLAHLEREAERVEMQEALFSRLPFSLRAIMQDLLSQLRPLLQTTAERVKEESLWCDMIGLKKELKNWGKRYSQYDMGGLHLKYSGHPTEFPDVNFALNSRRLFLENYIGEEVTEFAFRRAQRALDKVARAVRTERRFRSEQKNRYHRHHASVESLLDRAQVTTNLHELRELGSACIPIVARLNQYQKAFSRQA